MRLIPFLLMSLTAIASYAGTPVPGNLEPLPPPVFDAGPDNTAPEDQTGITITRQKDPVVEEYRVGGKLYMIKVIPQTGIPYYLIDDQGDGKFARQESLDSGFRPPRWVIRRF